MSQILEKKYDVEKLVLDSQEMPWYPEEEKQILGNESKREAQSAYVVFCQTDGSREEVEVANFPTPTFTWQG